MRPPTIHTPRLQLVAATLAHLEAELRNPGELGLLLDAQVPAGWPPGAYDEAAIRYLHKRVSHSGDSANGWYGWYAVWVDAPRTIVASGGYFGPPVQGTVEIGYSVVESFRRRGIASELTEALVARAFATRGVKQVIAYTDARNVASIATLQRAGFRQKGRGAEPGILRWERRPK